jgi:hypothetical protein
MRESYPERRRPGLWSRRKANRHGACLLANDANFVVLPAHSPKSSQPSGANGASSVIAESIDRP